MLARSANDAKMLGWPSSLSETETRVIDLLSAKGRLYLTELKADRAEIAAAITSLHLARGLPILQIARRLGKSQWFLWNICRALNIETRKVAEANRLSAPSRSKHPRRSFNGTDLDRAYLRGFSRGDLNVAKVSEISIFVSTTTTHPAFSNLFERLFSPYGYVYHYPIKDDLARFKWKVAVRLDRTFDFMLPDSMSESLAGLSTPALRAAWLAGLVDTDGTVALLRSGAFARFRVAISSSDRSMLSNVANQMKADGYHFDGPYRSERKGYATRRFNIVYQRDHWVILLQRNVEVKKLLTTLPLRHPEKIATKELILSTGGALRWDSILAKVENLRCTIQEQVSEYARRAELLWSERGRRNQGV